MIHVLRLGHRRQRDPRLTTHLVLTARALGADQVTVAEADRELEATIAGVVEKFGGPFEFRTGVSWKSAVADWKAHGGLVVHLTMYGEPMDSTVEGLQGRDVMLVVGAEKVPAELYELADVNAAVGSQPHSEVAAVALMLDRLTGGAWAGKRFKGRLRIEPNARGKTIIED